MIKVQKVYYCEYDHYIGEDGQNCCNVAVTTDIDYAKKLDKEYRLATIREVNMCIDDLELEDGYVKFIETADGIYGWVELYYETPLGLGNIECFMEYIFLQPNSEEEIRDLRRMIERSKKN